MSELYYVDDRLDVCKQTWPRSWVIEFAVGGNRRRAADRGRFVDKGVKFFYFSVFASFFFCWMVF